MKKYGSYIAILCLFTQVAAQEGLSVDNLRCEYRKNPVGVELSAPALSWELLSSMRNTRQAAYRIQVAEDSLSLTKGEAGSWDTQKQTGNTSLQVGYGGKKLVPAKKYFWRVMVWDNRGRHSAWSKPAAWQMGLPQRSDWRHAQWIAYDIIADTAIIAPHIHLNGKKSWGGRRNTLPMFRKTFAVEKRLKRATAFICGLGHFELYVNGRKTGDHFLDPGWTNYAKHAQYVGFDITDQVKKGSNAIGVMLGNGFYYIPGQRYRKMTGAYGLPKMILRTVIEYEDGSAEDIVSDQSWQTAPSPIIFSSIYGGEDYDATLEQQGWNTAAFSAQAWKPAVVTSGPPVLEAQMAEPVKLLQHFLPVQQKSLDSHTSVYDLGQNFSGIPRITVSGRRGDTVRIRPAELLTADGRANQKATGSPSYYTYVLKGDGAEQWQPRFSYYGFRYLQAECIAADSNGQLPKLLALEGWHMRNAADSVSSFSCSSELFNRTHSLINWAIKSNMVSVFTDCPHREKLGWLEETHLMGASVQYNYDIAALCRKVIRDMMQAQYPNGKIPEIAPEFTVFTPPFDESPEWGSAAIILPWYYYQWYGDRRILAEAYDMMKRYLGYLQGRSSEHIVSHGLGDWFDIGPKPSGFSQMTRMGITATAMYYYDITILAKVAGLLRKDADAAAYNRLAGEVRQAFNKTFFDPVKQQYDSASQTANAMALFMELAEPQQRDQAVKALVRDIRSRNNALTAGDVGYRYVLKALEAAGKNDVVFDMNSRYDVPGYGFQLQHGATALTESWQAYESVSNNHFMLGHLMEWLYAAVAGIRQAPQSAGWKQIEIRPEAVGDLQFATATFHSPYGLIGSAWKKTADGFALQVTIPANTTAAVYLPANKNSVIKEGAVSRRFRYTNGRALVTIGSGTYHFTVNN
ncbi:family 78 glycoside hydrolase catalytic domain [Sediminibacterium soli]|uniref:family 78 glycoside hydrolase catalytic domain n=1 Tax=Sediminibacterium soli TaxID=2698829 RepID=UPI0013795662|nr:family 78 glycoside hydrolase catalytic domain [Sediminibacterium soli]NCI48172.1 family 78 glycoside hydrolase catalytic domain [Sediminibacterium soli]